HLVNVLLPWRAGDLVRIAYVAFRYRLRASYVAATVLAERLSDIVVVLVLACIMLLEHWGPADALVPLLVLFGGAAALLIVYATLVGTSSAVRRWTWNACSLF